MPMLPLALPILMQLAPAAPEHARMLHLDEALQTALQNQPMIAQARGATAAAAGRTDQGRSGLLPQVTATALYERIHHPAGSVPVATSAGPTTSVPGTSNYWSFGASATQLLWDFNQTWDRYKAADLSTQSYKEQERTSALQVLLNSRRAYFTARADRALVRVASDTLANELKHYAQIQGFVTAGTHPEIDLVQEKTTVANDKVQLITAEGNYDTARAQLNQAMGVATDTNYDVADEALPTIDGEDLSDDRLMPVALKARPELVALERQRDADAATVRSLKGGYGPTLSAIGGASYTGVALDSLGPNWDIGAQLVWPIFQGGLTNGQVREAEGNLAAANAQLDAERLQVRFDVQQALVAVKTAKASIDAANDAMVNAREQLRLAEGRYTQGVGSIIELGDAQVALTSASAQVVQADFNLASARAQLLTALGRP